MLVYNNGGVNYQPVRNGDVFCSPYCGRGCTFEAHNEALLNAKILLMLLNNQTRWTIHLDEGVDGWGYVVKKGPIRIYRSGTGRYITHIQNNDILCAAGTPQEALTALLDLLYKRHAELQKVLVAIAEIEQLDEQA